jgi:hypothetical protein
VTGLVSTTVTNPVDMIKTQLYMSGKGGAAATAPLGAGAAFRFLSSGPLSRSNFVSGLV